MKGLEGQQENQTDSNRSALRKDISEVVAAHETAETDRQTD